MDAREQKGLALSRDKRVRHVSGRKWAVPSQSNETSAYLVNAVDGTCTCADFEARRRKCKHLFAVEFVRVVEMKADGSTTVTESLKVTRKT